MSNFWKGFLFIFTLSALCQFFAAWYIFVPIAFLAGYLFGTSPNKSALMGFFAIFMLWLATSVFFNWYYGSTMAPLLGNLLKGLSPIFIFILTGFIGGLVASFAAISGFFLRALIR